MPHALGSFSSQQEVQLARRAAQGDVTALDALFAQSKTTLYRIALRLVRNKEDAEDAVQGGLLAAYQNLPRFEGKSRFSSWLTRIVINAALMHLRRKRVRPSISFEQWYEEQKESAEERLAGQDPNPEDIYVGVELLNLLERNLAELSLTQRSAFLAREGRELSSAEAAHALGIRQLTLKSRVWRARKELAARLSPNLRFAPRESRDGRRRSAKFALAGD